MSEIDRFTRNEGIKDNVGVDMPSMQYNDCNNKDNRLHVMTPFLNKSTFSSSKKSNCTDWYKGIFDNNELPILLIDLESGLIVEANEVAFKYYGYTSNELIGLNINKINTLPSNEIKNAMAKTHEEYSATFHFKHRLASGEIRDVEVISKRVMLNWKLHLYSMVRDITEQLQLKQTIEEKQALLEEQNCEIQAQNEEYKQINELLIEKNNAFAELNDKLIKSELQYRLLFENMTAGFSLNQMIYDEEGNPINYRFIDVNPVFEKLTGLNVNEIRNKTALEVIPTIEQSWIDILGKVAKTGVPEAFEYYVSGLDRTHNTWIFSPAKDLSAVIFYDITEEKANKEALQRNTYFLEQSQRVARIGSYIFDIPNDKWEASAVLNEIFGIDITFEHNFENWASLISADKRECTLLYFSAQTEAQMPIDIEYSIERYNDGVMRWVHGKGEFIFDPEGKLKTMYGTIQDITEQKLANEILLQSEYQLQQQNEEYLSLNEELNETNQKIELMLEELTRAKDKAEESERLKSAFLTNLSHEIRTPLNAIVGFTELLYKNDFSVEKKKEFSAIIRSRADYLLNLIDDIIELSKIEAQQIKVNSEYFILNDLLNELAIQSKIKIQECNKHIQFILNKNLPSHFNHLFSDKLRVKQILNNLLNNAIKFTQDGEITLSCYVDDKDEFVFSVSDTGIGISERNQQFIFNRFRQVHDYIKLNTGGIGLGLSICLGVSKLLGGKLNVQSELGKGSTFFFSLPSSKVGYSNTYSRSSVSKLKKKLLLIEDDSYNRGLIVEILNKYELVLANNGLDALMHFNSIPDIDLVLMDIGLPDMSGLDVTKQIRLKNKKVPIIALTAYTSIKDKQNCLAAGCNDYISKPFDTILLAEKIESLLNDCYEQFVLES